ncbi:MAG: hypothetical protein ABIN99_14175 [Nitrosospira sp.]
MHATPSWIKGRRTVWLADTRVHRKSVVVSGGYLDMLKWLAEPPTEERTELIESSVMNLTRSGSSFRKPMKRFTP